MYYFKVYRYKKTASTENENIKMKPLKLTTKITLILSVMVCTIFIVQAFWSIKQENRERRDELFLRAKLVAEMQSDALSGPLWDYDQERAISSLNGILKDPDILQEIITHAKLPLIVITLTILLNL